MINAQTRYGDATAITQSQANCRCDLAHFKRALIYYSNRQLALELGAAAVQAVDDEFWSQVVWKSI
jgi:hypothetical protein